ncbi:rhodanese-like domain-containing protein [Enterococcus sp. DIV1314a]|uniref:rhodanese-like domain-containing protein n=1 Tax=Enterococcus sp. DIV1314a TaxID=2774660 RepID=UPI003F22F242
MNTITTQDFQLLLATQEVTILDIRDKGAFNEGHLANSLSLPITTLPNHLDALSKQNTYYIMSHSGRRARVITEFLNKNGFDAIAIIGGMKAFRQIKVA